MTFASLYKRITESEAFKMFSRENPDSEMVIGFFILNLESGTSQEQLDFKTKDKIFSFSVNQDDEIIVNQEELVESFEDKKLQKISPEIKVDLEDLKNIVQNKLNEEKIQNKLEKIIAILQINEKEEVWNLTCILYGLAIIHILVNPQSGEITKFERKSMSDFVKRV